MNFFLGYFKYYLNNILVNVLYYNFIFKISLFLLFNMTNLFNGDGCEFLLIYNFWDFLEVDMFFLN